MNRRSANNALVSLAGVLAESNADADAEVAQLQAQVQQLQVAYGQARAVVVAVREHLGPGAVPGPVETEMGPIFRVPADAMRVVREALKACP